MDNSFVIIEKPVENPYIVILQFENLSKQWFYNFIFGWEQELYIYFKNLQFNIDSLSFHKVKYQFEKDVFRTNFIINSNKYKDLSLILPIIRQSVYSKELLFLCSQSSLAFLVEQAHYSLNNKHNNLIIAETKLKKHKSMTIIVNTQENWVKIKKKLRVLKLIENNELIEIQEFTLNFHFQITNHHINCLVFIN